MNALTPFELPGSVQFPLNIPSSFHKIFVLLDTRDPVKVLPWVSNVPTGEEIFHNQNNFKSVTLEQIRQELLELPGHLSLPLLAIFGGHISGKRNPDVRVNPVFNEKHPKSDGIESSELDSENNNISDEQSNAEILANQNTGNQLTMVTNQEGQVSPRSERESLKVTNGSVLVGDIVIENGYENPGFEGDVLNSQTTIDEDGNRGETVKSTVEYSGKETDNNNISDWPDLDDITLTEAEVNDPNKEVCNHNNSDPSGLSQDTGLLNVDINHNAFHGDNENIMNKDDHGCHTNSKSNGVTPLENDDIELDAVIMRGKGDSKDWTQINGSEVNGGEVNGSEVNGGEVNGSEVNGGEVKAVKKIKERKNSVPEHIQNCATLDRPKGIKPILVSGISVEETDPSGEQSEHKSVKFSDDTVFNDGRPNKYRRDTKLINLREIYKGKVNSDFALAKPNPIFLDDSGLENSLTDDEKVARSWAQDEAVDIESIEMEEKPRYDRLIKQTIARQRRSKLIRLIFAFLAFLVVVAAVVLLVIYFGKS
ncbi:uncharacterized protein LOC117334772 [Pecten maximus]|uniref:uncharacterized protein LOC117334772 n=1 Tax=Pecten maximus TaxID=6579 RepID=UPI0014587292|nr:uncharacterized protein LOC117334772 [Pecten maximus]